MKTELMTDFLRTIFFVHHIYEIDVKSVYKSLFPSEMPINLFHRILSETWPLLERNDFPFASFNPDDEEIMEFDGEQSTVFMNLKDRAILELERHSTHPFVRVDYREITSACHKFLTGGPKILTKSNQVQFNALQNPSNARFMASSIQGLLSISSFGLGDTRKREYLGGIAKVLFILMFGVCSILEKIKYSI